MPQTEEEHLENQNLDYEDQEKSHPDAEVTDIFYHSKPLKNASLHRIQLKLCAVRRIALFRPHFFSIPKFSPNLYLILTWIYFIYFLSSACVKRKQTKQIKNIHRWYTVRQTPVLRRKSLIINRKPSAAAQVEPLYVKVNCRQEKKITTFLLMNKTQYIFFI